MAMLPAAFNANDHEDMSSFDPLPIAKYNMKIVEAEMKLTKAAQEAKDEGDPDYEHIGQRLALKFEVMDGPEKGKFFFTGLNLINAKSPKAVEISQKEFATLCRAIGKVTVSQTEELLECPVVLDLGQSGEATDQYGIQNFVKMYEPYTGETQEAPAGGSEGGPRTSPADAGVEAGAKKKLW